MATTTATATAADIMRSPGSKVLVRGILFSTLAVGTGDWLCQHLEQGEEGEQQQPLERKVWDQERTKRMAMATALVMAPTSWLLVMKLERLFPGNAAKAVLSKTVANGLLAAPMISLNFACITALEGNGVDHLQQRMSHRLLPTMASGICFWPFVSALNFRYVALQNRPVVGAVAGVCWNVYMSSQVNAKLPTTTANEKERKEEEQAAAATTSVANQEEVIPPSSRMGGLLKLMEMR